MEKSLTQITTVFKEQPVFVGMMVVQATTEILVCTVCGEDLADIPEDGAREAVHCDALVQAEVV